MCPFSSPVHFSHFSNKRISQHFHSHSLHNIPHRCQYPQVSSDTWARVFCLLASLLSPCPHLIFANMRERSPSTYVKPSPQSFQLLSAPFHEVNSHNGKGGTNGSAYKFSPLLESLCGGENFADILFAPSPSAFPTLALAYYLLFLCRSWVDRVAALQARVAPGNGPIESIWLR